MKFLVFAILLALAAAAYAYPSFVTVHKTGNYNISYILFEIVQMYRFLIDFFSFSLTDKQCILDKECTKECKKIGYPNSECNFDMLCVCWDD